MVEERECVVEDVGWRTRVLSGHTDEWRNINSDMVLDQEMWSWMRKLDDGLRRCCH